MCLVALLCLCDAASERYFQSSAAGSKGIYCVRLAVCGRLFAPHILSSHKWGPVAPTIWIGYETMISGTLKMYNSLSRLNVYNEMYVHFQGITVQNTKLTPKPCTMYRKWLVFLQILYIVQDILYIVRSGRKWFSRFTLVVQCTII